MFEKMWQGWHELGRRYCILSVLFLYRSVVMTQTSKGQNIFLLRLFYCGRRSSQPQRLLKPRRNRRRSSRFYGAIEALLYDPENYEGEIGVRTKRQKSPKGLKVEFL